MSIVRLTKVEGNTLHTGILGGIGRVFRVPFDKNDFGLVDLHARDILDHFNDFLLLRIMASGTVDRAGGLIGRIGDQIFGVGKSVTLVAKQSGRLQLRINDDDDGLHDNNGELTVEIRAER